MALRLENRVELQDAHRALFAKGAPAGGWILCNYVDLQYLISVVDGVLRWCQEGILGYGSDSESLRTS